VANQTNRIVKPIYWCVFLFLFFPVFLSAQTNLRSFGNSITRGEGLADSTERFSYMLSDYLEVHDLNGAVSGMTLVNNDFYEEEAIKDGIYQTNLLHSASDNNDYALIMFGTNDLRMIDTWDQDLDQSYVNQFRDYLQLMVDSLLEMGFDNRKIFLLSDPYTQGEAEGRDSIETITQQVAAANNTLTLNVRKAIQDQGISDGGWRSSYTDDTIHPNAQGHLVIFEILRDAYIAQATDCPVYSIDATVTNDVDGQGSGSIVLTVSGGVQLLEYSWSNGATTRDLESLQQGSYTVTVTDENMCTGTASFEVSNTESTTLTQSCSQLYQIPVIKTADDYANTVYIDPDYSGIESGTFEEPYNSWDDITEVENTAYLIKSGTSMDGFTVEANNNYIGKYGTGERPVIRQYLNVQGTDLVLDSLNVESYGDAQWQKVMDLGVTSHVTLANSYITGLVGTYDYPHTLVVGGGEYITFYNNIMSGAKSDGLYIGSSPYFTFVRNWLINTNMGGIESAYPGDAIQLEYDNYHHAYFAGNLIDRSSSMSKFGLILNGEDLTHSVISEWNTFVAPKNGNSGAAVRWLGGENTKFNKNLIITYLEEYSGGSAVSGIASYDVSATQEDPYGIRDNHFLGYGAMFFGVSDPDPTNLGFNTIADYETYLADNGIDPYGSDIDTSDFWGGVDCDESTSTQFVKRLEDLNSNAAVYFSQSANVLHIGNLRSVAETFRVQLISLNGEIIFADHIFLVAGGRLSISTAQIPRGAYILHLKNDRQAYSRTLRIDSAKR